jgi:hypothetical protein
MGICVLSGYTHNYDLAKLVYWMQNQYISKKPDYKTLGKYGGAECILTVKTHES